MFKHTEKDLFWVVLNESLRSLADVLLHCKQGVSPNKAISGGDRSLWARINFWLISPVCRADFRLESLQRHGSFFSWVVLQYGNHWVRRSKARAFVIETTWTVGAYSSSLWEQVPSLRYLRGLLRLHLVLMISHSLDWDNCGLVTRLNRLSFVGEDRLDVEQMQKVLTLQIVSSCLHRLLFYRLIVQDWFVWYN